MSRRKHQQRVEEHYSHRLAPWMAGFAGVCILLMLVIYVATMPL